MDNGQAICWGGTLEIDVSLPMGSAFSDVVVGEGFTCGIIAGTGRLQCVGSRANGRSSPPFVQASQISLSSTKGCAATVLV